MCTVIYYGFTINGSTKSYSPCDATTSDIIGAKVAVQTVASEVGKTLVASVGLRINDINQDTFYSEQFTPISSPALHELNIPFTGVPTQLGTYTFGYGGAGCSYIYDISDLSSYLCYSCSTTKCTTLIISQGCTTPGCTLTVT